jgi:hypothetical protein
MIAEEDLARRLGVSREAVAAVRRGLPPETWGQAGGRIVLGKEAEEAVVAALVPGDASIEALRAVQVPSAAKEGREDAELQVVRLTRNVHVVMARAPGAADLLRLKVARADNFRPGMKVMARHVQADLWEYAGRGPRSPGRW